MNFNNGYQNWKETIINVVIYQYVQQKISQENQQLVKKIQSIELAKQKTHQMQKNYLQLVQTLFANYNQITKRMEQIKNNQQSINSILKLKNIDLSYEQFNKWIKQGKQIQTGSF